MRIGQGYDVHQFATNRQLWLGGILIEHTKGLLGHSDADVLIHALCDALLGAACLYDIGYHFPDTDPRFKGIDSKVLLKETMRLVGDKGYKLVNCDCTVCAQAPKLRPYIDNMRKCLADIMQVDIDQISVKATTTEKLGFVGREEGIAAYATVLIDNK